MYILIGVAEFQISVGKMSDFCSVVPVDGIRENVLSISQIHKLLVLLVLVVISQHTHLPVTGSIAASVVKAESNE